MNIRDLWAKVSPVAKAIAAGVGAGVGFLIGAGVVDLDLNPWQTVTDLVANLGEFSTAQWVALAGSVLAVYGITWRVPNS